MEPLDKKSNTFVDERAPTVMLNWHCNELFALVMYKIMKHRGRMLQAQFTLAAVPYECAVQRDAGATST